ncbi:MAG TPA: HAD hydrolase family protein [Verrucomicrobiae bacterium]|nr:HAD hydrolase family protein [Verrucomicrobiae bacterium]
MLAKISPKASAKLRRIKLFLCDVDGVLTDGSIFIGGDKEFKRYNIRDGLGLVLLRRAGIKIGWVSARPSAATKLRADELKIHFLVQQNDCQSKSGAVETLLAQEKLSWNEVCFVGDDIVDLGPLKKAGFSVAVADGVDEAKAAADFITKHRGGHGAIREVVEMILKAQGKWDDFVKHYSE